VNGVTKLEGARVTVMGLGRFGGGVGVTRWLCAQGADVLVTDKDPEERLAGSLEQIEPLIRTGRVRLRLGGTDEAPHNVSDFTQTDLVIANPAVPKPWENRYLRAAEAAGVPVTTEIRLLVERLPRRERVVGITGSAGKSTTSAMIHAALSAGSERTHLGGNIGGSLLGSLRDIGEDDWVVLELSSAMLYWLSKGVGTPDASGWSPGVAVVTNFAANHLDWHGDLAHYAASKMQILRDQRSGDRAVLLAALAQWPTQARTKAGYGATSGVRYEWVNYADIDDTGPIATPGKHNRLNAAFARRIASIAGIDLFRSIDAIAKFPGLEHRLQRVGEFPFERDGVRGKVVAFNDSKSTTPESCALAIAAMNDEPAIGAAHTRLICGGYDKKIDLTRMIEPAARCAGVYTMGATGPGLASAIAKAGGRAGHFGTLDRAVGAAVRDLRPGDCLLLSPGCASWDQFEHFEQRGAQFVDLVRAALGRRSPETTRTGP